MQDEQTCLQEVTTDLQGSVKHSQVNVYNPLD